MDRRSITLLVLVGAALILVLAVRFLLPIVAPFVLGLFISCLIEPIVAFLDKKWKIRRRLGVPGVLLLILLVMGTGLTFGVARLYGELKGLLTDLPSVISAAEHAVRDLEQFFSKLPPQLAGVLSQSISRLGGLAEGLVRGAMGLVAVIPNVLLTLTISTIASFFISRDKDRIVTFVVDLAPLRWRDRTQAVRGEILNTTMSYLRAQLLLVTFTSILSIILLTVIGVQRALLLGLLLGLLDLLPMVGPSALFIPWIAYHALAGSGWYALLLAGVFIVLQVSRQIVESLLVGERLGVHPLAALLAVWAGIKLFGVMGFIFGPLILIIVKALAKGLQGMSPPAPPALGHH